jgi:hypothetical protein
MSPERKAMSPERKAHMWGWALKLARSGDHIGSGSIEKELEVLGFSAPQRWLSEGGRMHLDKLCAEARSGRADT